MTDFCKARTLLQQFKGAKYAFGAGALMHVGPMAAELGHSVAVICGTSSASHNVRDAVISSLGSAGTGVVGEIQGARSNAPREDVERMAQEVARLGPEVAVVIGGGSTIDAAKAACVLSTLNGPIDRYFGTALVSDALTRAGKALLPLVAVQMASSSAAHLTKYSNVTDLETAQKKLIVDDAIVPLRAVFQYDVTVSMPPGFTADGALDGLSHLIEVLYGAVGHASYDKVEEIAATGVSLIVRHAERAVAQPHDLEALEALGLGTDLGGYAIMVGGTNGGHLTSFSLVDILSHGRACAIMNPYYTVFFAPAMEKPLRSLVQIYRQAGLLTAPVDALSGRDLGLAAADAMLTLSHRLGVPTRLSDVEGFTDAHLERALAAAKDPQLAMKLQNMPVPLTAEMVDEYMRPVLDAARDGDLSRIKTVP